MVDIPGRVSTPAGIRTRTEAVGSGLSREFPIRPVIRGEWTERPRSETREFPADPAQNGE